MHGETGLCLALYYHKTGFFALTQTMRPPRLPGAIFADAQIIYNGMSVIFFPVLFCRGGL
jgi:hypothetical protein